MGDDTKKIRAKFHLNEVTLRRYSTFDSKVGADVVREQTMISAFPVGSTMNAKWANATPGGRLELTIDNAEAAKFFKPGMSFIATLEVAPEREEDEPK